MMLIFYILIVVLVMLIYNLLKGHRTIQVFFFFLLFFPFIFISWRLILYNIVVVFATIHFEWVNFTVSKLYLNILCLKIQK